MDIALGALLLVALGVLGWSLVRTAQLRRKAGEYESEMSIQLDLTTRLLEGTTIDDTLPAAADALVEIFELDGCEVRARTSAATSGTIGDAPNVQVETGGVAVSARRHAPLSASDEALLESLVASVATAVDRLQLREEVRDVRLAAEISQQRAGFLSAISHNLRTPLTAVKAAASTLLASWSRLEPEERRELLETIADEAERLERLVRNTLELSRIRAGALELELQPVDIGDLVQHAVRRLRPISRAHVVRLDVDDNLPEVWLDITMIEQILLNLLENALRYAPPGSEILVSVRPEGHQFALRVSDHGPGVAVADRDLVFEEFQVSQHNDRGGTGLGLAIVRALVRAQGGTVRYEETPGGGATFVCLFPMEPR